MVNLYITVGATIPFDGMINTIFENLNENILKHLLSLSPNEINIFAQCGSTFNFLYEKDIINQVDKNLVVKTINPYNKLLNTEELKSVTFKKQNININITFFNLSSNLNNFLREFKPNIVISHAGTGSLLDALANNNNNNNKKDSNENLGVKKIVAVVNDSLMNNHQLEIGEKLESYGLLTCCKNLKELEQNMKRGNFIKDNSKNIDDTRTFSNEKLLQRGFNEAFNNEVLMF
ncbi:hypothetical protein HANVADRAFT_47276 [Hanseniaspora valbyensis NRRL Y-1626]|uniref:UDP-N-acetylglucosamine transferase subunit ALG13 n=1 Tax=Hanseniaspora valbyensis NRRL Y-1626 TaxID=766949 RepID=A0A1B7TIP4_9ASCO|nr:hypothetical protein HANVADRAFT_47276 [Hanseniaspora valbyensis NRRL Y-1626]